MTHRWREPDSNHQSRSDERLFWALPIGDGGTTGGATYRLRARYSNVCLDYPIAFPFAEGPTVRFHLPPGKSLRTFGPGRREIAVAFSSSTSVSKVVHLLAMDYPSHRSGLANPRTDNRKPRPRDPRPNRWGPPAPDSRPTSRKDHCEPNAAKPVRGSIDARSWVLDASHRPNRWALDGSSDPATPLGPLSR